MLFKHPCWTFLSSPHLQRQVIFERVRPADGIAEARATHHHPAAVLRRVAHAHSVLWKGRQPQACRV